MLKEVGRKRRGSEAHYMTNSRHITRRAIPSASIRFTPRISVTYRLASCRLNRYTAEGCFSGSPADAVK